MPQLTTRRAQLLLFAATWASACGDPAAPPDIGGIAVSVTTSGADPDPNGYQIHLDGRPRQTLPGQGRVVLIGVAPGHHVLELAGVASNCRVSGGERRPVEVPPSGTAEVAFEVSCPVVGSLRVITHTTGSPHDRDRYVVRLVGLGGYAIGLDETLVLTELAVGTYVVELALVAPNCAVAGAPQREVQVTASRVATVSFEVSCGPVEEIGTVVVTVSTTAILVGSDLTFTVVLDGTRRRPVGAQESITFADLPSGPHSVLLADLPAYCQVGGFNPTPNPVRFTLHAGEVRTVRFPVLCLG